MDERTRGRVAKIEEEIVATVRLWHEADNRANAHDPEIVDTAAEMRVFDEAMEERERHLDRLHKLVYDLEEAAGD